MEQHAKARSSPWPRRLVIGGLVWGALTLTTTAIAEPTPENLTLLVAIPASGLYTLLLLGTRPLWLPRLARRPLRNAVLLSAGNAAVVETLFLVSEHLLGAEGVAAHPNLLIDLLITMPWYVLMAGAYVRVQHRQRFAPATVLLLGAAYESGADGIASQVIGLLLGDSQLLEPVYWLLLALAAFWQFIPVYSSMVLPPAWLIAAAPSPPAPPTPAWRDALKPLLWLIPFTVYAVVAILILAMLGLA